MELDFGKIARIKDIQERMSELSEEGKDLSSPLLTDIRLVGEIYDIFSGMVENPASAEQRKKFIFIILYLFSPGTLAGGKMASGLRGGDCKRYRCKIAQLRIKQQCRHVIHIPTLRIFSEGSRTYFHGSYKEDRRKGAYKRTGCFGHLNFFGGQFAYKNFDFKPLFSGSCYPPMPGSGRRTNVGTMYACLLIPEASTMTKEKRMAKPPPVQVGHVHFDPP